MNQLLNKIPYGLLTEDEQAGFSTEMKNRGLYEVYDKMWHRAYKDYSFMNYRTYRLKILPDEWYWCDDLNGNCAAIEGQKLINALDMVAFDEYMTLRPALPEEIPKPEPTLLERIEAAYEGKEVVLLKWDEHCDDVFMLNMKYKDCHWNHVTAQSMKGFAGYVYTEFNDIEPYDKFELHCDPSLMYIGVDKRFMRLPVAVLFSK